MAGGIWNDASGELVAGLGPACRNASFRPPFTTTGQRLHEPLEWICRRGVADGPGIPETKNMRWGCSRQDKPGFLHEDGPKRPGGSTDGSMERRSCYRFVLTNTPGHGSSARTSRVSVQRIMIPGDSCGRRQKTARCSHYQDSSLPSQKSNLLITRQIYSIFGRVGRAECSIFQPGWISLSVEEQQRPFRGRGLARGNRNRL